MSSARETARDLLKPCRRGQLDEDVEKGHSPLSWGSPEPERWPVSLHHPQAPAAGSLPSSNGEGDARKGQGPWAVLGSEIASRPQRVGGALMEGRKGHSGWGAGAPSSERAGGTFPFLLLLHGGCVSARKTLIDSSSLPSVGLQR